MKLEELKELALVLAKSGVIPEKLRGQPSDVLATIMAGDELGLAPMQSIRGLHIIDGKIVMSADMMRALIKRSDKCEKFALISSTDKLAIFESKRVGQDSVRMEWGIEQAQKAGLGTRGPWQKYPADMLRARCSAALARCEWPDIVFGVYDPDEAVDFSDVKEVRDVRPAVSNAAPALAAKPDVLQPSLPVASQAKVPEVLPPKVEPAAAPQPTDEAAPKQEPILALSPPGKALQELVASSKSLAELKQLTVKIKDLPEADRSPITAFATKLWRQIQADEKAKAGK